MQASDECFINQGFIVTQTYALEDQFKKRIYSALFQIKIAHKKECGQNIGASNSIVRKPKHFTGMQIVYKRKVESYNCTHNAVGM